jgi:uncharacterized membrane protein
MQRLVYPVLFCLVWSLSVFAADFNFTSFDFPGCSLTRPFGVNARGQIVGLCRTPAAHGFLFDPDHGTYMTIDVPGATFTNAGGINASGDIVGRWTDTAGSSHAYLRTHDGQFTFFDPPAPCAITKLAAVPHGINDAGDIVGRCFDSNGKEFGFLRSRDGTFTIVDVPGAATTDAWVLDNAGVIVGDYSDASGFVHGYLRTLAGEFVTLDFPGYSTGLRWINERGDITGIYGTDEAGPFHGFLLRDGVFTTVDYPGSFTNGGTLVISNNGLIVGGYVDAAGNEHGFVAIEIRRARRVP